MYVLLMLICICHMTISKLLSATLFTKVNGMNSFTEFSRGKNLKGMSYEIALILFSSVGRAVQRTITKLHSQVMNYYISAASIHTGMP